MGYAGVFFGTAIVTSSLILIWLISVAWCQRGKKREDGEDS